MLESKALPKYRCHKIVSAMQVYSVLLDRRSDPDPVPTRLLMPVDRSLSPISVTQAWANKHLSPFATGSYYVVYEDGYASMSPAKAFEDGYTLMPGSTVEECITDYQHFSDSMKAQPNYVKTTDSSSVPPAGQKSNDPQALLTEIQQQLGRFADAMKIKGHTVHLSIVPTHVDLSLRPTTPIHLSWNVSDTYRVYFKKDAFEQVAKDLPPAGHPASEETRVQSVLGHCRQLLRLFKQHNGVAAKEIRVSKGDWKSLGAELKKFAAEIPCTILSHDFAPNEGTTWYLDDTLEDGKPVIK